MPRAWVIWFVLWLAVGAALGSLAVVAWGAPLTLRGWVESLQASYGAGRPPALLLRADLHLHALTALILACWFALGLRLFLPRGLPWTALALAAMVAGADELAQIGSAERSFEWSDQIGDAIGLALALLPAWLIARIRFAAQSTTASSSANKTRS
ncbi:MAG TPA: hypothetical protein DCS97_10810 [Planctomycetes bacterium]|nr:hypothetical protein [Planctomycetota bacterium]